MSLRAFVYVAYSLVVAAALAVVSRAALQSALRAFELAAVACLLGGALSFVAIAVARRRRWGAFAEYLLGMVGRTGAPSCVALCCVATLDEQFARAVVLRIFALYAVTAPAHVWLTIASSLRADACAEAVESCADE